MNNKITSFTNLIESRFLIIVAVISIAALFFPAGFTWMKPHIPKFLGIIMFGMGVTLKFSDFSKIWKQKHLVIIGFLAQYILMPVLAVVISKLLGLPEELMIGMVIVGACPGGTASNVVCYLAGANVALSVTLTLTSTLLAPLVTPFIIYILLSHEVNIEFMPMMISVFWIVLFPLLDGLVLRHFLQKRLEKYLSIFPSISIIAIALIIGCVIALNKALILSFPILVILAVILHNVSGLSAGYLVGKLFKCSKEDTRTIAIEVGMQNSGLGVSLATQFFSAASALPAAIFSLWHNISGITIAKYWKGK